MHGRHASARTQPQTSSGSSKSCPASWSIELHESRQGVPSQNILADSSKLQCGKRPRFLSRCVPQYGCNEVWKGVRRLCGFAILIDVNRGNRAVHAMFHSGEVLILSTLETEVAL